MRREVYACDSSCKRGGGGGLVPCPACPTNRIVLLSTHSKLQRTMPPPPLTAGTDHAHRRSTARVVALGHGESPRQENRRKLPAICAVTATAGSSGYVSQGPQACLACTV